MNEKYILKHLEKWVMYAIYILLIVSAVNTCTTCQSSKEDTRMKKEITSLSSEVDSLYTIITDFKSIVATKSDIEKDNDKQMSKFLYWEREADKPQYKDYTPKDYEKLIKEK